MDAPGPKEESRFPGFRADERYELVLLGNVYDIQLLRLDSEAETESAQLPRNFIDLGVATKLARSVLPGELPRDVNMRRALAQGSCGGQLAYNALVGGGGERAEMPIPLSDLANYIRTKMTAGEKSTSVDVSATRLGGDRAEALQKLQAFLNDRNLCESRDASDKGGKKKALAPGGSKLQTDGHYSGHSDLEKAFDNHLVLVALRPVGGLASGQSAGAAQKVVLCFVPQLGIPVCFLSNPDLLRVKQLY